MPNARSRLSIRRKSELKKAFDSAESNDEKLKKFAAMEKYFEDKELVKELILLAFHFDGVPDKVLFFGKRALTVLIQNENTYMPGFDYLIDNGTSTTSTRPTNHTSSLFISTVLVLLGRASLALKRYHECLSYANWANRNFTRLVDHHSSSPATFVLQSVVVSLELMAQVKGAMGRKDEVVVHLKKLLEVKEKYVGEGSVELVQDIKHVYEAYMSVGNSKDALPFCLKALEICEKHSGRESDEVADIRRGLCLIYSSMGEFEKALEQNQLSQCTVKNVTPDFSDNLKVENGYLLVELGRYEEAVNILKGMVADAATERGRASACVFLAKALWKSEKTADARKYLKMARKILEKKGIDPIMVAITYNDMSGQYEAMNDCETAISMLKRALTVPEFPQELLPKCSERLFSLISRIGKEEEGVRYLEDMVDILKRKFGPNHREVGYGYKNLGLAYAKLGQDELATKFLANAKDIMDVSLGLEHMKSLGTSEALSLSYSNMGRYNVAVDNQARVVRSFKELGPREQVCLDETVKKLNELKCVAESPVSPQSKDGEDLC